MAEEKVGPILLAKTEGAMNQRLNESQSAMKSRAEDGFPDSSRPTSGPTSIDLGPVIHPSHSPTPEVRAPRKSAVDSVAYHEFRRICDDLMMEVKRASDYLVEGTMSDMGMEVVVEVEQILDELYRNTWGTNECLKRIVVAIGSQIYNVRWTAAHVGFLKDVVRLLRISYLIDESLVAECLKLIRDHRLEVFRGSIAETEVRTRYRIVEVD